MPQLVKLQDSGQASFEETTKQIELLKFPYHDFIVYDTNVVLFLEKVNKKSKFNSDSSRSGLLNFL